MIVSSVAGWAVVTGAVGVVIAALLFTAAHWVAGLATGRQLGRLGFAVVEKYLRWAREGLG